MRGPPRRPPPTCAVIAAPSRCVPVCARGVRGVHRRGGTRERGMKDSCAHACMHARTGAGQVRYATVQTITVLGLFVNTILSFFLSFFIPRMCLFIIVNRGKYIYMYMYIYIG